MSRIKKMLVGVDGSTTSYRAAEIALDLAKALNAQVTVIYVVPTLPPDYKVLGLNLEARAPALSKVVKIF
ncbi:MAG: universal stress protein [Candidatus Nezhaarchaeales archaeon]